MPLNPSDEGYNKRYDGNEGCAQSVLWLFLVLVIFYAVLYIFFVEWPF